MCNISKVGAALLLAITGAHAESSTGQKIIAVINTTPYQILDLEVRVYEPTVMEKIQYDPPRLFNPPTIGNIDPWRAVKVYVDKDVCVFDLIA